MLLKNNRKNVPVKYAFRMAKSRTTSFLTLANVQALVELSTFSVCYNGFILKSEKR
jgi:hypothetical protein